MQDKGTNCVCTDWNIPGNTYLSGNDRPCIVMTTLNDLHQTPLYRSKGIVINNKWEKLVEKNIKPNIKSPFDIHTTNSSYNEAGI